MTGSSKTTAPLQPWIDEAVRQKWRIRENQRTHRLIWYPPGGGKPVVTGSDPLEANHGMQNARTALRRAGLRNI